MVVQHCEEPGCDEYLGVNYPSKHCANHRLPVGDLYVHAADLSDGDVVDIGNASMIVRRKYIRDGLVRFNAYAGRTDRGLDMTYRENESIKLLYRQGVRA